MALIRAKFGIFVCIEHSLERKSRQSTQLFGDVVRKVQNFSQIHTSCSTVFSDRVRLTKGACIQYLKGCKSMGELKQIHAQVFRIGHHQNNDIFNKLSVFSADPVLGNLRYAERIFDYAEEPNLFIYNVMIKAYAKSRRFRTVLLLFEELRVNGLWPDNFTYPFTFKAAGCLGDALRGEKIRGFVVKTGNEFDCYVCNAIMDMYSELGHVGSLKRVFDEMPQRDLVSWNVLISGFVKCDKFEDAILVYRQLRKEGNIRPDEATVVSTLSACTVLKELELGKEIHQYVCNELEFTTTISNALLDMYSKCGCLGVAREIFDAMPTKNVICWTSMVSGYANSGRLDEARELFQRSPVRDVVLWTAMLNGYVQFNCFDEAMALFREMQMDQLIPDKFTVVVLLTGCAQLGALEQGKWIHNYVKEKGITVDAVVGTALIDMYAKCGCIEELLKIFNELKDRDTAVWTSVICGLAMNGKTSEALEFFFAMRQAGCRPDDITFIGVLSACSHGGLVEEGRRCFDSMTKIYHIEPKLEHYGCFIDLLGRAGLLNEAEKLLETMAKINNRIIVPVYGALLSACRTHGNIDVGERVAKRLVEIQSSDSGVHTLLANLYASADRWADVTKVRRRMTDVGVRKEPGCSSIEVNGTVHEFLVRDATHPDVNEVYSMLNSTAKPLAGINFDMEENDLLINEACCFV